MGIIRAEHVARLLCAEDGNPVLIVHGGRADVISASDLDDPRYKGAMRLADRSDLVPAQGGEPTDAEIEALAQRLDTAVSRQGG